jgi:hypothetical protein
MMIVDPTWRSTVLFYDPSIAHVHGPGGPILGAKSAFLCGGAFVCTWNGCHHEARTTVRHASSQAVSHISGMWRPLMSLPRVRPLSTNPSYLQYGMKMRFSSRSYPCLNMSSPCLQVGLVKSWGLWTGLCCAITTRASLNCQYCSSMQAKLTSRVLRTNRFLPW